MTGLDRILLETSTVRMGRFRCRPDHPRFHDAGPIFHHVFVFPSNPVAITHAGRPTVVADANTVMFYNRSQEYRRSKIDDRGDRCIWYRVATDAILDAMSVYDRSVVDRPDRPYPFVQGPSESRLFARHRRLVSRLTHGGADALWAEEEVLALLAGVTGRAFEALGERTVAPIEGRTRRRHADLVEAAKECVARRFRERLRLDAIADEVEASPFHLSRVFRAGTGETLHRYVTRLRLHAALEALEDLSTDLSTLAHELGFSSHSHLTATFRRAFGATPSRLRRELRPTG